MALYRIYFDANSGTDESGVDLFDLGISGSLEDIAPIADKLHEGMRVIIYMTGEQEMEAILEYSTKYRRWMARPIEGTIKYLDG